MEKGNIGEKQNVMICNIDTNRALETGSNYTLELLDRLGLWGALIFIVVLVVSGISIYITIVFTKKLLHRKEFNLKKLETENKKEELRQSKEALGNIIMLYEKNNEQFRLLSDKIQFSLNIDRITILTDCFIGVDRSFIQDLKAKLLFHVENAGNVNNNADFMYLYHEVEIVFKQKVIDKLKPSLFKDRTTFYKIEKDCRMSLKQSLDRVRKKIENTNMKDVFNISVFINDELRDLGNNLQEIIINSYKKQITNSTDVDYLRL
jgi:hypothetical protein